MRLPRIAFIFTSVVCSFSIVICFVLSPPGLLSALRLCDLSLSEWGRVRNLRKSSHTSLTTSLHAIQRSWARSLAFSGWTTPISMPL